MAASGESSQTSEKASETSNVEAKKDSFNEFYSEVSII